MQSVKGLPVRTEVPVALLPSLLPSLAVAGQEEVVARVKIVTRRNARCGRLERDRWNASILISGGQRSVTERYVAEAFWWGCWKGKVAKTSTTGTSHLL
jgi:hypothetical protein